MLFYCLFVLGLAIWGFKRKGPVVFLWIFAMYLFIQLESIALVVVTFVYGLLKIAGSEQSEEKNSRLGDLFEKMSYGHITSNYHLDDDDNYDYTSYNHNSSGNRRFHDNDYDEHGASDYAYGDEFYDDCGGDFSSYDDAMNYFDDYSGD